MSDQTPKQIVTRWSGAINSDSELGRAIVDIRVLAAQCEALEKQSARFKEIGQEFERDHRNTFEQSCKNLQRAEAAESAIATLTARCEALEHQQAALKVIIVENNIVWYGPRPCAVCGVEIVKAAKESGGMELEVPARLMRIYRMGTESNDIDVVYPMVWRPHVHA